MDDYDKLIEDGVESLPVTRRVLFAASCTERLMSGYHAFELAASWGNYHRLRRILDDVWNSMGLYPDNDPHITMLIAECDESVPDDDRFPSMFTVVAQDAAGALISTLKCWRTGDVFHAINASRTVLDALSIYLYDATNPAIGYSHKDVSSFLDGTFTRLAGEWLIDRYRVLSAGERAFYAWRDSAPLLIAEYERQLSDIRLLQLETMVIADVVSCMRLASQLEGIQPFARWWIADNREGAQ